jgi:hypothetical protein
MEVQMLIQETRSIVIANIWQAIAQSGVDLSTLPKEDQEELVLSITDSVLMTYDSIMNEEFNSSEFKVNEIENGEKVLWKGRPFLSLVESYVITTERIKFIKGLVSRQVENFELIRIQDIDYKQNVSERIFGLGDITIRGHDPSDPILIFRNVSNPEEVYELLRKGWLEARKRHGLQFREYM